MPDDRADTTAFKEERLELEAIARRFEGTLGICAARVDGPEITLGVNADEPFPAGSVIQLAVALEVFCQAETGALSLSERVPLKEADKVVGAGVLAALAEGLTPTVADLVFLAMSVSDVTAANMLVDRVGTAAINERLAALGLEKTFLSGKLLAVETKDCPPATEDYGAAVSTSRAGDDGRGERSPVTARDLVRLLRAVHRRDGLPARACEALLATLERAQTASSIRRGLPESRFRDRTPARLYNKTGSLRGVVNDAGIVATERGAYAVALLSKGSRDLRPTQDNVARIALAEASRVVYKAMRED